MVERTKIGGLERLAEGQMVEHRRGEKNMSLVKCFIQRNTRLH